MHKNEVRKKGVSISKIPLPLYKIITSANNERHAGESKLQMKTEINISTNSLSGSSKIENSGFRGCSL